MHHARITTALMLALALAVAGGGASPAAAYASDAREVGVVEEVTSPEELPLGTSEGVEQAATTPAEQTLDGEAGSGTSENDATSPTNGSAEVPAVVLSGEAVEADPQAGTPDPVAAAGAEGKTEGDAAGTQEPEAQAPGSDQLAPESTPESTEPNPDPAVQEEPELWHGLYHRSSSTDDLAKPQVIAVQGTSLVFDPKGGKVAVGTALQLYTSNDTVNQRFGLEDAGDGTYVIRGLKSNLVLSIQGGVAKAGAALVLEKLNNSLCQHWMLIADEAGETFRIASATAHDLLVSMGGDAAAGSALVLGEEADGHAVTCAFYHPVPLVEDGPYALMNITDNRYVIDCANSTPAKGVNVQTWTANTSTSQAMRLEWNARLGYYQIACGGYALDCQGGGTSHGTNVRLWTANGTEAQLWSLRQRADSALEILSAKSGLELGVTANALGKGRNICIYTPTTATARGWRLVSKAPVSVLDEVGVKLASEHEAYTLWNGLYLPVKGAVPTGAVVLNLSGTNFVFDPKGGKTTAGTPVQLYANNDTINQRFAFKKNADGTYSIIALKSNLALSLAKGAVKAGLGLVLEKPSSQVRQKWVVAFADDGCIVSLRSAANRSLVVGAKQGPVKGSALVLKKTGSADTKLRAYQPCPTIPDGSYLLANRKNASYVIDVQGSKAAKGSSLRSWYGTDGKTQRLRVEWDQRVGYYRIRSSVGNLVFDCKGGGVKAGTPVQLWTSNNTPAQYWSFELMPGMRGYDVRSAKSGLQLAIKGDNVGWGGAIVLQGATYASARGWCAKRSAEQVDDNSSSQKLAIPTDWYGLGETYQAYHPKVVAFEEPWHGYRYWMAYTPYPKSNSSYEDPCLCASNDLLHWEVPEGMVNPIDDLHLDGTSLVYNSDTHLLYNPDTGLLELFWRRKDYDDVYLYRVTSADGITWSNREEIMHRRGVAIDDALSPVFMYEEGTYRLWYVADRLGTTYYTESTDCQNWAPARHVCLPHQATALKTWHLDVERTPAGYELIACAFDDYKTSYNSMCLYHSVSQDGITGWSAPRLVLEPTTGTSCWDNRGLYRSCLLYEDGTYYLFYGGTSTGGLHGIGLAAGSSLDQLERVVA